VIESPRKRHALELFAGLPRFYDRMGAVLSLGQDPRWRRALVRAVDPRPGQRILDVATGTGMVAFALAAGADDVEVVGLDQSEAMLSVARARNEASGHGGVSFEQGEAEHLPFPDATFDALSFTYLLRYVDDPATTLRELARVVKPGGRIAMLEFGVPSRPRLRALWRIYTRAALPVIGLLVSHAWYDVGRFLGPNIEQFHAAEPDLPGLWNDAGITDVTVNRMSFGAGLVMWGVRDGNAAA
jgi:demethylmenaquinone methyltransferase / 2-methoxy-6-polyprenyl-1,4-benzoquinol methylase